MSPYSLNIDRFSDFPSESPTNNHITKLATTISDLDTLQIDTQTLRRSLRQIQRPKGYKNFHITYPSSIVANLSTNITLHSLSYVLPYNKLYTSYQQVILSITQQVEPQSYNVASKDPNWIEAMNAKIKALEVNSTWILTDLS